MCLIFSSLWQIAFTSACTHTHRHALTAVSLSHTFNLSCRIQSQSPESEMDNYASFISEALEKTKCRECVPSWEEIQMLMNRQEMLCTVHYPGPGSCQLYISSHTTANEVWKHFPVFYLAAQLFWAGFGVFQLLTSSNSKFHSAIKSLVKCSLFCLHPWSPNNLWVHLSFQSASPSSSPGGSKDAREARPTREQKYICTIRAECTVGAASHRKRSGRRHPNQVWKSDLSVFTLEDRTNKKVSHNKTKQTCYQNIVAKSLFVTL